MQTIQTIAKEVLKCMTTVTRDSGETIHVLRDGSPEWMGDLIQESHSGSLPDDHTYAFIVEALNAIADHDDEDDARDSIEGDTYNRDLLSWVSSSLNRAEYVNQGVDEFGSASAFDLFDALRVGQLVEKREVFESVLSQIETRLDEVEAA